ncbi:hypothetical protein TW95_gp1399 [Pandoravirus inopinatum]|uniref:Uncharacterized protein n=1 Tax=Pandoravirus inopinatum TaxID=1605721 RepID=A0A0B5IZ23_9VIRU|nr:hypothetical protein TW95_gp1399 [Pandoravirus inopinatum]AJF98133.1 hypothetical protein [Pandoravirus inopinatum]
MLLLLRRPACSGGVVASVVARVGVGTSGLVGPRLALRCMTRRIVGGRRRATHADDLVGVIVHGRGHGRRHRSVRLVFIPRFAAHYTFGADDLALAARQRLRLVRVGFSELRNTLNSRMSMSVSKSTVGSNSEASLLRIEISSGAATRDRPPSAIAGVPFSPRGPFCRRAFLAGPRAVHACARCRCLSSRGLFRLFVWRSPSGAGVGKRNGQKKQRLGQFSRKAPARCCAFVWSQMASIIRRPFAAGQKRQSFFPSCGPAFCRGRRRKKKRHAGCTGCAVLSCIGRPPPRSSSCRRGTTFLVCLGRLANESFVFFPDSLRLLRPRRPLLWCLALSRFFPFFFPAATARHAVGECAGRRAREAPASVGAARPHQGQTPGRESKKPWG